MRSRHDARRVDYLLSSFGYFLGDSLRVVKRPQILQKAAAFFAPEAQETGVIR